MAYSRQTSYSHKAASCDTVFVADDVRVTRAMPARSPKKRPSPGEGEEHQVRTDDIDNSTGIRLAGTAFRSARKRKRKHKHKARVSQPATQQSNRCFLLELPAELRDMIWTHAVTEWQSPADQAPQSSVPLLQKRPIRLDRFNRPSPPPITYVCQQIRHETLSLYYEHNIFECWRPIFFRDDRDWILSTFGDWLLSLGPERTKWLRKIVLLYKHENELEHDISWALTEAGFDLDEGVISERCELSEYELCYESLGLPRHFGKRKVWDRWTAGSTLP